MTQVFDSRTIELAETSSNDTRNETGTPAFVAERSGFNLGIEQFLQCPGSSRRVWDELSRVQEGQVFSPDASLYMGVGFFVEAIPDADTRQSYAQVSTNPQRSLGAGLHGSDKWIAKRCIFVINPNRGAAHLGELLRNHSTEPDTVDRFTQEYSKDWNPEWLRMIKGLDSFGSDTSITIGPANVVRQAVDLVLSVPCEDEGWDADFASELNRIIQRFGEAAIEELELELHDGQRGAEIVEEIVFQLGAIEHEPTRNKRFSILGQFLKSDDVRLRHMAALGFAEMNHPLAGDALRQAISLELSARLRRNLIRIIEKLERTQEWHAS